MGAPCRYQPARARGGARTGAGKQMGGFEATDHQSQDELRKPKPGLTFLEPRLPWTWRPHGKETRQCVT